MNATPELDDDFLEEALVLMGLEHESIGRLVGLSCIHRPFYLVTEWSEYGTLDQCLGLFNNTPDVSVDSKGGDNDDWGAPEKYEGDNGVEARFDVFLQVSVCGGVFTVKLRQIFLVPFT